jgi:hypothetical protein
MMREISIDLVAQALEQLLRDDGRPVMLRAQDSWKLCEVPAHVAVGQDGLLPAMLVAAESIWRGATGKGFHVGLARDADSLLGYRVNGVSGVSFSGLMLSAMEGLDQIARPQGFMSHELSMVVDHMNKLFGQSGARPMAHPEAMPGPKAS